jgi:Na+/H+-dicarboxylate symporter
VAISSYILDLVPFSLDLSSALGEIEVSTATRTAAASGPVGFAEGLVSLLPRNPFTAAAEGNLPQLLTFTLMVGAAIGCLPEGTRTQSSLASVPGLTQGARDELKLPEEAMGVVIPLRPQRSSRAPPCIRPSPASSWLVCSGWIWGSEL